MREEFKFVRGLYTKKKLFNDDIINDSFVILDEKSDKVSFDAEDDNITQSQLINASNSSRVRKVYTITPDKITMEGNLEKEGNYKFTPTMKEIVDDEIIPENVKTKAETFLEEHLTADYSALSKDDIGIGEGTSPEPVKVTFKDESGKSFTRDMKFRVEGKVNKRLFTEIADGPVILTNNTLYAFSSDGSRYDVINDVSEIDVFLGGRKQKAVQGSPMSFPKNEITLTQKSNLAIANESAHTYVAPNGYYFEVNGDDTLTSDEIMENDDESYTLHIEDGAVGDTHLTFKLPTNFRDYIYDSDFDVFPDIYNFYFITSSGNFEKMTKDNYPYGQNIIIYNSGDYNVYDKSVYENDPDDDRLYKVLGSSQEEDVSTDFVEMLDEKTISPKSNNEYIVELGTSSIKARES